MECVYDIETYQNLFTATFLDIATEKIYTFVIGEERDDSQALLTFMRKVKTLIGYNSLSFDDPILFHLLINIKNGITPQDIYDLGQRIIADRERQDPELRRIRWAKYTWDQIDLMTILMVGVSSLSLKQMAINLYWPRIQDLPFHYTQLIKPDEVDTILDYNLNDVQITYKLYKTILDKIQLRKDISKRYGVKVLSSSDSQIANKIFDHLYVKASGIELSELKKLRTKRENLWVKDCIPYNASFKSPILLKLIEKLKTIELHNSDYYLSQFLQEKDLTHADLKKNKKLTKQAFKYAKDHAFKYSETITLNKKTYVIGVGGLHSEDKPGKFYTDDKYIIRDADVTSYYPAIIINNGIIPEHLDENFTIILKQIITERVQAKKEKDLVKAATLKITGNSTFGKMNSDSYWLEDAKALISVTIAGQLYLLMLIERLNDAGIEIISANTDGIICKINREKEEQYFAICKQWEQDLNLSLDYTDYKLYVRRVVNSYITQKMIPDYVLNKLTPQLDVISFSNYEIICKSVPDDIRIEWKDLTYRTLPNGNVSIKGETKIKGDFLKDVDLQKAFKYPIVKESLYHYFVNGVPINETLDNCKFILDFCMSQKMDDKFQAEVVTNEIEELQKTNRFYVSNSGGKMQKREKGTNKITRLVVGETMTILNDYDESLPFENYDVNIAYYEAECLKVIDEIEPLWFGQRV